MSDVVSKAQLTVFKMIIISKKYLKYHKQRLLGYTPHYRGLASSEAEMPVPLQPRGSSTVLPPQAMPRSLLMRNTWETALPPRPWVSSRHRAIKGWAEVSFPASHQECSEGNRYSQEDGWPGWGSLHL